MKRRLLIAALVVFACVALGLGLLARRNPMADITPTIIESAGPETVEQARRQLPGLWLPDSARNVQYVSYREWQAAIDLLRFEAPVEDCRVFAERLITRRNAERPRDPVPGLRPLDRSGRDPRQPVARKDAPSGAPWFRPQAIRRGLVAGETGSHTPRIWIDTEQGVLYYEYTD